MVTSTHLERDGVNEGKNCSQVVLAVWNPRTIRRDSEMDEVHSLVPAAAGCRHESRFYTQHTGC